MTMISYAQNGEDVLLERVLAETDGGFYIDVGAAHPEGDSVTKHFYDKGWRGVNVEPAHAFVELLKADRPRDVNLEVALSSEPGRMTFYESPEGEGWSTLSSEVAGSLRERGVDVVERELEVTTLAAVCEEHAAGERIDFLKIDVEGHERQVIEGGDWERWRPRVLVVEATFPHSTVQTHGEWEQLLLGARYSFATFDGINRFYVREEDLSSLDRFAAPVNYLDDFVPHRFASLRGRLAENAAAFRSLEQQFFAVQEDLAAARADSEEKGRRLGTAAEEAGATRARLATLEAAYADAQMLLESCRSAALVLAASAPDPAEPPAPGLRQQIRGAVTSKLRR